MDRRSTPGAAARWLLGITLAISGACSGDRAKADPPRAEGIAPSPADRVDREGAWLRPHLPEEALRGVVHSVTVALPARATGAFQLADVDSGLSVEVALSGARDVPGEIAGGLVVYRGAHPNGADVIHRPTAEGTEDYVAFERAPEAPELRYELRLDARTAGVRLVARTLELLDAGGAPRLRMAPPYVVDVSGERREASVAVTGCAFDTDPRAPWGRPVTAPGARRCVVRVAWSEAGVRYPALVDPLWTGTGAMTTTRSCHAAAGLSGDRVLVSGGYMVKANGALFGSPYHSAEVYDPGTGTWASTGMMLAGRCTHTVSALASGRVLAAGGDGPGSTEVYDPAVGTWTARPPLATPRGGHTASVLSSGKVLVAGGYGAAPLASAEVYTPTTQTWGPAGVMAAARSSHTASVLGSGQVLVAGGYDAGFNAIASAEVYNPATNGWSPAGTMTAARTSHTASVLPSGQVLVAGGDLLAASAELYDPATSGWTATSPMTAGRISHTASVLGGRVLVAGGIAPNTGPPPASDLPSAEVYDPATQVWSPAGVMAVARDSHTATVLPSRSKVLIAGGAGNALTELFAFLPAGSACTSPGQCASASCTDGVCCASACAGLCQACNSARTGAADGTCAPVTAGTDPDGDCAADPVPTCKQDGFCNGLGACHLYAPGTASAAADCAGGVPTTYTCDGAGNPVAHASAGCLGYLCFDGACTTTCATSGDCAQGAWCDAGACQVQAGVGQPCATAMECTTGWCHAGVCAVGTAAGEACATADECGTGFCVDGFCCNGPCAEACQACDVAGAAGICVPVSGAPHGARPACDAGDGGQACSARVCDGVDGTACQGFTGSQTPCGAASCAGGVATLAASCDGKGTCPAASVACAPFGCSADACNTTCAKDDDCAPTYRCQGGQCLSGATCDGDHTVTLGDGTTVDCGRYRCEGNGTCPAKCGSVDACVLPNICDESGRCTAPPSGWGLDQGSGCALSRSGPAPRGGGLAVVALAGMALLCRARRRRKGGAAALLAIVAGCSAGGHGDADPPLPGPPAGGARHLAAVALPARANGAFRVTDVDTGLSVEVALAGAAPAPAEIADGLVVYRRGYAGGADITHRPTAAGTEDSVYFERAPGVPELRYEVRLGALVAGVRLVARTLELLDAGGAPRLRMAPPYVVDASGERREASVAVSGCAHDTDPRPPWGRPVTAPGARRCAVQVAWGGVRYPALVDPQWTTTGTMIEARTEHTAGVLASSQVLVAGGTGAGARLASAELYDPVTATWASAPPMSLARSSPTATVLGSGKVLVAGGDGVNFPLGSAELYDPITGSWHVTAGSMATPRFFHTASLLAGDKVLVAGGQQSSQNPQSSAEIYDPALDGWSATGSLSIARTHHAAVSLLSGKVLVTGGGDTFGQAETASVELYDPATGKWTTQAPLSHPRFFHTASVLPGGRVLVAGGDKDVAMSPTAVATAELYDPVAGTWSLTGSLAIPRDTHTAVVLASGHVLVAGGVGPFFAPIATAELYDPSTGTWTPASALATARVGHTASLFASGAVLVAGGVDPNSALLASAELLAFSPPGSPCALPGDCAFGCADGVCCDTPCSGLCQACTAAKTGVANGTCAPVTAGTDPNGDCPTDLGSTCQRDGACDGKGACHLYPAGTPCTPPTCVAGAPGGKVCDGAGTCAAQSVDCKGYLCAAGACLTSCATAADCAPSAWCNAGACQPRSGAGQPCVVAEACATGLCVDGVCCNAPCGGQCEACDVLHAEGTCLVVSDTPHGARPACDQGAPGEPCSQKVCDGIERALCNGFVGSAVSCRAASCADGAEELPLSCDAHGSCPAAGPGTTKKCEPFACAADACKTSCAADADCAAGYRCDGEMCSPGACDGDHTVLSGSERLDCSPFRCTPQGGCGLDCKSVDDCAAPNACDDHGRCVAPPAGDSGQAGGCGVGPSPRPPARPPAAWLATLALAGLARRLRSGRTARTSCRPAPSTPP